MTCDLVRYVFKPTLAEGKNSIISRTMGSKLVKMVYKARSQRRVVRCEAGGGSETVDTSEEEQNSWSASDQEVKDLAEMAVKIEKHYGRPMDGSSFRMSFRMLSHAFACFRMLSLVGRNFETCRLPRQDIEWARDGDDGKLYIVQARPETVASQKKVGVIEEYKMLEKGRGIPHRRTLLHASRSTALR